MKSQIAIRKSPIPNWVPALVVWALAVTCVQADITTGLVGHWAFNGDFTDSSGNGNHGQAIGNTAVVKDPEHGSVAEFDGTGDYIEVPNSATLNITGTEITLAAWAYYDDVAGNPEILIAKVYQETAHASPYFSYGLHLLSNGQPRFWLRLGTASRNVPGTVGMIQSQGWYHVAGVYNGSQMVLYVNGQPVATANYTGNVTGYNTVLRLGINGGLTEPMDGKIDDVRIYNRALSAEDVAEAMQGVPDPSARAPQPRDGALHEVTWVNLSWSPGGFAVSHDVYLGDNFDDVNAGAAGTFRGNQTSTSLFAGLGLPGDPYPGGLVPGTTYYWRIDEVNSADPNSPWKGDVWSFTVPPRKAYNPGPPDAAKFIGLQGTVLSWTGGMNAKVHTVYFSDSFDDVNSGTGGAFQAETTYSPGTLQLEKTYYWRVDEFDGAATHKGDVWSFTTTIPGLGTAVVERWNNISTTSLGALKNDPRYPNNPDVVETVTRFAWDGPDANDYGGRIEAWLYVPATGNYTFWLNTDDQGELWLSTDDDSGSIGLIAKESSYTSLNAWGTGEERSQPIPLVGGQKYYIMALWKEGTGGDHCQVAWQGPGITARTIIPGSNLSPYEPLNAFGATPANGATGVSQTPVLQWKPGLEAASSEVYFGTDPNAVKNATKASPEYKGIRALGAESYSPGTLAWGTTYYWRVDEVNNANPDSPWAGAVWSFTTADFLVIDDIESYNDIDPPDPESHTIFAAWIDGYATPTTNGALVGNNLPPYTERTNVHSGAQAMPLSYENNLKFSEATLTLKTGNDWTREGVANLSLWFRGAATNAAERMYVVLNGTAVVYNNDTSLTQKTAWTEWVIPLQQFVGVNLTNVTSITIGFGTRGNTTLPGGTGQMYFDDIRLYRP
jgi:hypothetical protein